MRLKTSLLTLTIATAIASFTAKAALPTGGQVLGSLKALNKINATLFNYAVNGIPQKVDDFFYGVPANYHYPFPEQDYANIKPGYEFNNFYVFGDSLSDIGSNGRHSLYLAGGYDAELYADYLSRTYTGKASVPYSKGGTNYGMRGASMLRFEKNRKSIAEQYADFLEKKNGAIDPHSLYIVWGGNMDVNILVAKNIGNIITGKYDINAPEFGFNRSPQQVAVITQDLLNRGAPYVFTSNMPDSTLFPYNTMLFTEQVTEAILPPLKLPYNWIIRAVGRNVDAYLRNPANIVEAPGRDYFRLNQINVIYSRVFWYLIPKPIIAAAYDFVSENLQHKPINQFNYSLNEALKNVSGNVVYFDFAALLDEVAYRYKEYGFDTVLVPTCTLGYSSRYCDLKDPDYRGEVSLFSDWFHPSPQFHLMIGQTMRAIFDAPVYVSAIARQADSINRSRLTYLYNQLDALRDAPSPDPQKLGFFIGYSGATDTSGVYIERRKTHTHLLNIGVYTYLNPNWLIGGSVALGTGKNHSHINYKYDFNSQNLSFFSQYTFPNQAWVNVNLALGRLKADDIVRSTLIYKNLIHHKGATKSYAYSAALRGGIDLLPKEGAGQTGPLFELAVNHYQVDGYREQGKAFLAMKYGKHHYNNHYAGLGWYYRLRDVKVAGKSLTLNAEATFNHELGKRNFRVPASLISAPVGFKRKIENQDKQWVNTQVGANYAWSDATSVNLNLGYTTDFKRNQGVSYSLGVSHQF